MTEASGYPWDVMGSGSTTGGASGDRRHQVGVGAPVGGEVAEGADLRQLGDAEPGSGLAPEAAAETSPSPVDVAEAWLAELSDQVSVPASDVQDHLLDLWGVLDEGPTRVEVERWLTETLGRNLYSVSDINDRLDGLLPVH